MINVLLFAGLQEKAGKSDITIDRQSMTVTELIDYLRKQEDNLELTNVMVAVNEEYVDNPKQTIHSGDKVALLPPVSGG